MYTIKVFAHDRLWYTCHDDPAILELCGTQYVPTPYFASIPLDQVIRRLQQLNPFCCIKSVDVDLIQAERSKMFAAITRSTQGVKNVKL